MHCCFPAHWEPDHTTLHLEDVMLSTRICCNSTIPDTFHHMLLVVEFGQCEPQCPPCQRNFWACTPRVQACVGTPCFSHLNATPWIMRAIADLAQIRRDFFALLHAREPWTGRYLRATPCMYSRCMLPTLPASSNCQAFTDSLHPKVALPCLHTSSSSPPTSISSTGTSI